MKLIKGLKHQSDAIKSVISVFEDVEMFDSNSLVSNPLIDLNSSFLSSNIMSVQDNNSIPNEYRTTLLMIAV